MPQAVIDPEMVRNAQLGNRASMDTLVNAVRERVYAYLCRATLDGHTAEDLTQDTVVAVLRSLPLLRQSDRFWPWVLTIASNNVRQQYRTQAAARIAHDHLLARKQREMSCLLHARSEASDASDLAQLTVETIDDMNERDRAILALRLYDKMPYAQIADLLGCSHLSARVAFFRARRSLRQRMAASTCCL
jgi:RNA polymerase sigma-70 factor (ECF subfamily)